MKDDEIVEVLYHGEFYIPRATFEEHREALLRITKLHAVTIRIVDEDET